MREVERDKNRKSAIEYRERMTKAAHTPRFTPETLKTTHTTAVESNLHTVEPHQNSPDDTVPLRRFSYPVTSPTAKDIADDDEIHFVQPYELTLKETDVAATLRMPSTGNVSSILPQQQDGSIEGTDLDVTDQDSTAASPLSPTNQSAAAARNKN